MRLRHTQSNGGRCVFLTPGFSQVFPVGPSLPGSADGNENLVAIESALGGPVPPKIHVKFGADANIVADETDPEICEGGEVFQFTAGSIPPFVALFAEETCPIGVPHLRVVVGW